MISFQTNMPSLVAANNLRVNNLQQQQTITQLTSGYRINNSGDDAAGLAVANGYKSFVSELTQGIRNANDGLATLQIIDGGLSNISTMLNRMKTLATQSATSTFAGNRATLNTEFQGLLAEIDSQAAKIGLGSGSNYASRFNQTLNVYIGGGGDSGATSQVSLSLGGSANRVDSGGLGLTGTTINAGGQTTVGAKNLLAGSFLTSSATQDFTVNVVDSAGVNTIVTATVNGGSAAGVTGQQAVDQLNNQLSGYGITASLNSSTGFLQFASANAFSVQSAAAGDLTDPTGLSPAVAVSNAGLYKVSGLTSYVAVTGVNTEQLTISSNGVARIVSLSASNAGSLASAIDAINTQSAGLGIYAVQNAAGTGIELQSLSTFSYSVDSNGAQGAFGADTVNTAATAPTVSGGVTGAAQAAITAVNNAVSALGLAQGNVGAGQNWLNYAINLAESQVTNYSAAESRIRDADIAQAAANLTKGQVLAQASVAALSQANAIPQSLLALLK